jgi:hypothetical protein
MKKHKSKTRIQSLVPKSSQEYKELMLIRKTLLEAQRMLEDGYQAAIKNSSNGSIIMANPNNLCGFPFKKD